MSHNPVQKDRVAVVSGGSSGIGHAIVQKFINHDIIVVNADVRQVESRTSFNSGRYLYQKTDISSVEDNQQLHSYVHSKTDCPSILICNAGVGIHEKLSEGDPEKWLRVINVNLVGTLRILRTFLPDLLKHKQSDIIFISSVAANNPYEYGGIYSATKAALDSIATTLRLELKEKGRVTVISPGVVDTSFFNSMVSGSLDIASIGYGSLSPDEVAEAALYALTRPSSQVVNNITLRPVKQHF